MQVRKQQLELYMEKLTGSKLRKEYSKGVMLSPCLFNFYAEFIMKTYKLQARIDTARRNTNNLRYAVDNTNGRNRRGTKEPLKGKGGE